jgi:hypothetical protein
MVRRALLLAVFLLNGCDEPKRCTFGTNVGILNVRVRDARTKAPICDATVVGGEEGGGRFDLVVGADCVYSKNSLHIDGVYDVDVGHPQYEIGEREGVTLVHAKGECFWYANLEIDLEPKAP